DGDHRAIAQALAAELAGEVTLVLAAVVVTLDPHDQPPKHVAGRERVADRLRLEGHADDRPALLVGRSRGADPRRGPKQLGLADDVKAVAAMSCAVIGRRP